MPRFRSIIFVVGLVSILVGCYVSWQRVQGAKERQCIENMNTLWNSARALVFVRWHRGMPATTNLALPNVEIDVNQLVREFKVVGQCPCGAAYPNFSLYDGPHCSSGHELPHEWVRVWQFTLSGPTNKSALITTLSDQSVEMRKAAVMLIPASVQHGIIGALESQDLLTHMRDDSDVGVRMASIQSSELLHDLTSNADGNSATNNSSSNCWPLSELAPSE